MRRVSLALLVSVALAGCVQTRQYADVEFTPPQGDYKLLVMRPDVEVGSVTTGGLVEPRADWTETARTKVMAALRAQQAARGGNVMIMEKRNSLPGVDPEAVAELERLHYAVGSSIALHKYSGAYLPTKRGKGLDWTRGVAGARCCRLFCRLLRPEHRRSRPVRLCQPGRSQDWRGRVVQRAASRE